MRVFVTGATGLIGSHLSERLVADGHEVVALCREGAGTLFLEAAGCRVVVGDIRHSAEALTGHMRGCTHVVHSAALVYSGGAWPKVRDVNVLGTRNVVNAAVDAGVDHLLHVSSVAVYGGALGPIDESCLDRAWRRAKHARSRPSAVFPSRWCAPRPSTGSGTD